MNTISFQMKTIFSTTTCAKFYLSSKSLFRSNAENHTLVQK